MKYQPHEVKWLADLSLVSGVIVTEADAPILVKFSRKKPCKFCSSDFDFDFDSNSIIIQDGKENPKVLDMTHLFYVLTPSVYRTAKGAHIWNLAAVVPNKKIPKQTSA